MQRSDGGMCSEVDASGLSRLSCWMSVLPLLSL